MTAKRFDISELPWLPRLSENFRRRLQAVGQTGGADWGIELQALATQYLGLNQVMAIARQLAKLREQGPRSSLSHFRLGLVSNSTVDFLKPFLEASALRYGILLEIVAADFGQMVQEAIDPNSRINRSKPDAVLLAVDHRGLPFRRTSQSDWPPYDHRPAFEALSLVRESFRAHSGAACLVQTLPAPAEVLFGSLDSGILGTLRGSIAKFNALLTENVPSCGDLLVDIEWLAQCVGLDEWYDERHWYLARMAFSQKALPLYADFVCRVIAAIRGKSHKCLVLDLDNTLWGGVIGDDGLDGIALNQGDPRGEVFRAIQSTAADLRRRGVLLAVCSKNDEAIAREVFRSHRGMILKEEDIAVFVANWEDKAINIERIAKQLDLGLDAFVLLDDNPAERALVRENLPQVAVPELGDDPSTYARTLLAAGYFESIGFTQEDIRRAEQYRSNASREQLKVASRDLDSFLRSLDMEICFAPFDLHGRKRIVQLINKTNQFNLTTRRYTESQVLEFESASGYYTLQISLKDRFGDNGMISAVICKVSDEEWEIDTWLMSCRVLNRRVEEAVCNRIARDAQRAGAKRLIGIYRPTERNGLVKDLYEKLGFSLSQPRNDAQAWVLELDGFMPFDVPLAEPGAPVRVMPRVE